MPADRIKQLIIPVSSYLFHIFSTIFPKNTHVGMVLIWFIGLVFLIIFMIAAKKCMDHSSTSRSNELRGRLTAEDAVEIYRRKLILLNSNNSESPQTRRIKQRNERATLANKYHVSSKAIMDVWNHKTWVQATSHLWEPE